MLRPSGAGGGKASMTGSVGTRTKADDAGSATIPLSTESTSTVEGGGSVSWTEEPELMVLQAWLSLARGLGVTWLLGVTVTSDASEITCRDCRGVLCNGPSGV